MKTIRKILNIMLLLAIIILAAWRLFNNKKEINQEKQLSIDDEIIIPVTTEKVTRKEIIEIYSFSGKFEALNSASILSETQGLITSCNISEGDEVRAGKAVIQIENQILSNQLRLAEENFKKAELDFLRFKNLESEDAVSESQAETIRLAFRNADITRDNAQEQLKKTRVLSPIDGYISALYVKRGENIGPGTPLFEVSDINDLLINIRLTEKDIVNVFKGMSVKISPEVYPDIDLDGFIRNINVKADMSGRYKITVLVKNTDKKKILPGMTGTVRITLNKGKHLVIPRNAVSGSLEDAHVYIVKNNICFTRKTLVEPVSENLLKVISGLDQDELIVSSGQINLTDSARIKQVSK